MSASLVGSEMCIRDRAAPEARVPPSALGAPEARVLRARWAPEARALRGAVCPEARVPPRCAGG
eukprot:347932-Alexandrium_andersonii.AAC.1